MSRLACQVCGCLLDYDVVCPVCNDGMLDVVVTEEWCDRHQLMPETEIVRPDDESYETD